MTAAIEETAYAKINLALHVRGRRADGYHDLETLFAFVDAGDRLTAVAADDVTLAISGPFAAGLDPASNLVIQVANYLKQHFGIDAGAELTLEKNLPVSSGIGGGSADAAATARLLNKLWKLEATDFELAAMLAPLGADIPACVFSTTLIGKGTGTKLTSVDIDDISGTPVLLVNPVQPVSTAEIFRRWDGIDRGAMLGDTALAIARGGRNDLQSIATAICPQINDVLTELSKTSPVLARMSGSGATCFALYDSTKALEAAQSGIKPEWWTLAGKLR